MNNRTTTIMALMGIAILSSGLTYAISQPQTTATLVQETPMILGHVTAILTDSDGNIKAYRQTDNRIVDVGLDVLANQLFGNGSTTTTLAETAGTVKAMAIGTGGDTTTTAFTDTDITSQATITGCANKTGAANDSLFNEGTTGPDSTSVVNMVANVTFQGSAGCNGSIREAGLFTDITGTQDGVMFARQVFTDVSVGSSDSLTLNWDILFTGS